MGTWGVAILILVVAAALVAAFFLIWKKDQSRSHGMADDDRRLDPAERKRTDHARRTHEARGARGARGTHDPGRRDPDRPEAH